jgi:hypothetical protein
MLSTLRIQCRKNKGIAGAVAAKTRFIESPTRFEKLLDADVYAWKSGCYRFIMETTRIHTAMLLRDIVDIMLRTTIAVVAVASVAVVFAAHSAI